MKPLAGIAALSLMAACSSDLTGGNMHPVQLSFTTKTAISGSANRVAADLVVGPANDLTLKRVQLVFRKLELDQDGTANCTAEADDDLNDDSEHSDMRHDGNADEECETVVSAPILVDVPLDDALHPVIKVPLPAGQFRELEAKLGPARSSSTTFNADNPNLVGHSVRVEYTLGTSPTLLVFTSNVRSKLEMEFEPALVVDQITKNATINVDVRNWFLTSTGAVIDPSTATSGSANLRLIESNIRRSFHAFEDDHERGEDRHEGHGS
jgi:hypothetical protein